MIIKKQNKTKKQKKTLSDDGATDTIEKIRRKRKKKTAGQMIDLQL